jgi:hypothetical protein
VGCPELQRRLARRPDPVKHSRSLLTRAPITTSNGRADHAPARPFLTQESFRGKQSRNGPQTFEGQDRALIIRAAEAELDRTPPGHGRRRSGVSTVCARKRACGRRCRLPARANAQTIETNGPCS